MNDEQKDVVELIKTTLETLTMATENIDDDVEMLKQLLSTSADITECFKKFVDEKREVRRFQGVFDTGVKMRSYEEQMVKRWELRAKMLKACIDVLSKMKIVEE